MNRREFMAVGLTAGAVVGSTASAQEARSNRPKFRLKYAPHFGMFKISEGNLIPNMDIAWDEIGYFQIGDNPGRNEPTTGEINYRNIFKHIHEKGYTGVLGMEHGISRKGKEGEMAVIEAYRYCDDF